MNTPATLKDLTYMTEVHKIDTASVSVQFEAERVFSENFGDEYRPELGVTVRHLFTEKDDDGNHVRVYEAYKDSGSSDYAYLLSTI